MIFREILCFLEVTVKLSENNIGSPRKLKKMINLEIIELKSLNLKNYDKYSFFTRNHILFFVLRTLYTYYIF